MTRSRKHLAQDELERRIRGAPAKARGPVPVPVPVPAPIPKGFPPLPTQTLDGLDILGFVIFAALGSAIVIVIACGP